MNADRGRRLGRLEARQASRMPRYVVLRKLPGDRDSVDRIAWVKPNGVAILVLPHNGRDSVSGAPV